MPYCPNGHGEKSGQFCDECAAATVAQPPGDSVRVRSPQASAAVSQSIFLPGSHAPGSLPALVRCPRCGRRNREEEVFDCQGQCGREHLCLRHFDEEYDVCQDCARSLRGADKAATEAAAAQRKALAEWKLRAEKAEEELAALTQRHQQSESRHQQTAAKGEAERSRWQESERSLNGQIAHWRERAEKAEGTLPTLRSQLAAAQSAQEQATKGESAAQSEAGRLQKELTAWQKRAESAEGELSAIRRREAEARTAAEEAAKREAEEARRRAESDKRTSLLWQKIGIEAVTIPAGRFFYGENNQSVRLDEFRIAKTPVTVAQFRAFVEATDYITTAEKEGSAWGYDGKEWKNIPGANWRLPRGSGSDVRGKEKHPVTCVSWHDAMAFCQWAGVRLPSEQEWEKAARGTDGFLYPWGNEEPDAQRCNFAMNISDTTSVERYPSGASPYGCLDMAGNVWEWCVDWFDSTQKARVLRGGSFYLNASYVRCAFRSGRNPDARHFNGGFRVVLPPGF